MKIKGLLLLAGFAFVSISSYSQKKEMIIAIGSCDNEDKPQELWPDVVRQKPMLWIWGGDNIYADSGDSTNLKRRYTKQKSDPGYQQLLKTCPITGTWDDHDYGMNDGGKFWPHRDIAKKMELEFLGIPKSNPVWSHPGIYNSLTIGEGKNKVKIINLDTRYFRDTLIKVFYKPEGTEKKEYKYEINATGDILGDTQWQWLENELKNSDAALNIVNSSIQVISEEHRFEKWANFPVARERLFKVLAASKKKILLISGDRHISEFSKINLPGMDYPLYEFLSSGLTHTWPEPWVEPNKYRIGDHVVKKSFGIISINWGDKDFNVRMQIRGKDDQLFQEHVATFAR